MASKKWSAQETLMELARLVDAFELEHDISDVDENGAHCARRCKACELEGLKSVARAGELRAQGFRL